MGALRSLRGDSSFPRKGLTEEDSELWKESQGEASASGEANGERRKEEIVHQTSLSLATVHERVTCAPGVPKGQQEVKALLIVSANSLNRQHQARAAVVSHLPLREEACFPFFPAISFHLCRLVSCGGWTTLFQCVPGVVFAELFVDLI